MLAAAPEQAAGDRDGRVLIAQRLDRRAGGDAAIERQVGRSGIGGDRRARKGGGEIATNDGRRKPAALAGRRCGAFARQLYDLQRAGAVRQSADEAALLEPADQAMDARFRAQPQRVLHLVEGRRDAGSSQPLIDEHQQLVLLSGQHQCLLPGGKPGNKPKTVALF